MPFQIGARDNCCHYVQRASAVAFTRALESIDTYKMPFGESVLSWGPDKHLGSSDAFLFVVEDGRFVRADSMKYEY